MSKSTLVFSFLGVLLAGAANAELVFPAPAPNPAPISNNLSFPSPRRDPTAIPNNLANPANIPNSLANPANIPNNLANPANIPNNLANPANIPNNLANQVNVPEPQPDPGAENPAENKCGLNVGVPKGFSGQLNSNVFSGDDDDNDVRSLVTFDPEDRVRSIIEKLQRADSNVLLDVARLPRPLPAVLRSFGWNPSRFPFMRASMLASLLRSEAFMGEIGDHFFDRFPGPDPRSTWRLLDRQVNREISLGRSFLANPSSGGCGGGGAIGVVTGPLNDDTPTLGH